MAAGRQRQDQDHGAGPQRDLGHRRFRRGGTGELGPIGLLEEIDYSIVDRAKVDPAFTYKYGVANYMFSTVMAWDTKKVTGTPTLADFFDIQKFPGRRMLRRSNQGMLELALLADGVPPTSSSRWMWSAHSRSWRPSSSTFCSGTAVPRARACCAMARSSWAGCGTPAPTC
jgi:hypothetical protein